MPGASAGRGTNPSRPQKDALPRAEQLHVAEFFSGEVILLVPSRGFEQGKVLLRAGQGFAEVQIGNLSHAGTRFDPTE